MLRLTYGDVQLDHCTVRQFEQSVLYDPSNTDKIGCRINLSVSGYVPIEQSADWFQNKSQSPQSYQQAVSGLIRKLNEPRRRLTLVWVLKTAPAGSESRDAVLWVEPYSPQIGEGLPDSPTFCDIANGPQPQNVAIERLYGPYSCRIHFTVTCVVVASEDAAAETYALKGGVLNNRWAVEEMMDANWYITRRIRGQMTIVGNFGHSPDSGPAGSLPGLPTFCRYLAYPTLEAGFRRESITFHATEDGKTCTYEIVDRQVRDAAPYPATSFSGDVQLEMSMSFDAVVQLRFNLAGPPHVSPVDLVATGIHCLEAFTGNLAEVSQEPENGILLEHATLAAHYGERSAATVTARLRHYPKVGKDGESTLTAEYLTNLNTQWIRPRLELTEGQYNPAQSQLPNIWGYTPHAGERRPAVLATLYCYLQVPHGPHYIPTSPTIPPELRESEAESEEPSIQETDTEIPQTSPGDKYRTDDTTLYTFAALSSTYQISESRAAVPLTVYDENGLVRELGDRQSEDIREPVCAVIRLTQPQVRRIVRFTLECVGRYPDIPDPADYEVGQSDQAKAKLLRYDIEQHAPRPGPDGRQLIYRTTGEYEYALTNWDKSLELVHGVLPIVDQKSKETTFSVNDLIDEERMTP